jgi:lipoprotein NlpD
MYAPANTLGNRIIALENGLSYRDLALWNGISNPSYIQIDQVLRLTAPAAMATSATGPAPSVSANPSSAGVSGVSGVAQSSPIMMPGERGVTVTPTISTVAVPAVVTPSTATSSTPAAAPANTVVWQWPVAKAKLSSSYVEGKTKGVDFTGNIGDTISSAADGKVVYAGNALKGYGQMLIVKHSDIYLTAYAHNSRLLVKEDDVVKRGQKIAEMGNTESDNGQIKLHFELRRSGKPVDPTKLLPTQ